MHTRLMHGCVRATAAAITVALAVAAQGAAGAASPAASLKSDAQLKARYAQAPSKFVTVDGVPFHIRDEGRGPALVLLNGHLGSLHMWDDWMPKLAREFRVIRLDYPPYGLSGPDPSGVYSTERAVQLLDKLANELGLKKFHIGGTSNGALVALFYAIEHPERIDRLVVSTLPAGRPPKRTPSPALVQAAEAARQQAPYQPREFWDAFLHDVLANDAVITAQLIDRYTDLNNRAGAKTWVDAYIQSQYKLWDTLDVHAYYAKLTRPILIQWGADGVVLPRKIGEEVAALFVNAPTQLMQYQHAGHMPMIEQPEATVRDAIAFLRKGTLH